MPRYIALRDTWLSHECRLVKEGHEFTTEFPEGMKLSGNLQLVEDEKPVDDEKPAAKGKKGPAPDDLV